MGYKFQLPKVKIANATSATSFEHYAKDVMHYTTRGNSEGCAIRYAVHKQ
jgi:hypothetical protein